MPAHPAEHLVAALLFRMPFLLQAGLHKGRQFRLLRYAGGNKGSAATGQSCFRQTRKVLSRQPGRLLPAHARGPSALAGKAPFATPGPARYLTLLLIL